ncbi:MULTISPECIES: ABC transporter ATP-binding protein [Dethiosulfovibrio]|jgi:NitT/TauT family transport system ATP-binding protein|uniref:ABC transporter ATP-binding protein n=2 Tax=Dethiosulfovibrio TaxID=47054 RepID=A0ABS9EMH3_9BACT|nr:MULTISPECIES: ABC transporter ATP-binding protein [Dethiosulfovibrio]MCF4113286.1 ABC transporter ATP-binding protein [Dethiosulfovibrio russensis]MCF4142350.1 ABC transporter ATP-binding protein [Dethiosulfovibrio marinus]MCF4145638.1 ABC transporter ATP-binding protein [Dethiosulfovibrio acidaminovorans]MEA3285726.1 ABC transporter ATP-binding protein [Synergistota bacterium]
MAEAVEMTVPVISVSSLEKTFVTEKGDLVKALAPVDLEVKSNEFICIVGPSGCGKSTMLRILAGLETPTGGEARYMSYEISGPGRERGMVFQEYSLLPWRTVAGNLGLGPELAGEKPESYGGLVEEYLELVGLSDFADAYPYELSGGMRQRAAIARALVNNPEVLLMDEPFGALDAHTRILLQGELLRIWETHRKTVLFVTHSVDEAVSLADRIVVMSARPGRIREIITVPIERPRRRSDPRFGELAYEVLSMLDREVGCRS